MHVIEDAAGRKANTHAIGAPHFRNGFGDFKRQPGAVPYGAAIVVSAAVRAIAEELIQQIAVGIVNFHAVEASDFGALSSGGILRHDARQLRDLQGARRDVRLHSGLRESLAGLRGDSAGRDRQPAARLEARVRDPAHVPELKKNAAARVMRGLSDFSPAGDLFVGIDSGCVGTARALLGNRRGFCDDQARRRPLRIVLGH